MAWMTTAEIKTYNKITVTDYDTDIDLWNPIAEAKVKSYTNKPDQDTLWDGYQYDYARYVYLLSTQYVSTNTGKEAKSQSMDGESITYKDSADDSSMIASTIDGALHKFKPLVKKYR